MHQARTPLIVAVHVWHALFMREASARITGDRLGWTWLFLEPLAHIAILVSLRQLMGRIRFIPGAEFVPWLIVGIMAFLLFRNAMNRSMNAISANKGLFAYRQVHPFDTVFVRAIVEGVLKTTVLAVLIAIAEFLNISVIPADAVTAATIWFAIWLLGFGFGLIFSVVVTTVQEMAKFIAMLTFPLYFLSGVILPVQLKPRAIQEYLLYNPVLHGLESLRYAFFENYRSISGISTTYLWFWAISTILLGLMLQIRFKARLQAQ